MASNIVSIQHLRSEQEEEDTLMLVHALVATQSGATSIFIQSQDTDVLVLISGFTRDFVRIPRWLHRRKENEEVFHYAHSTRWSEKTLWRLYLAFILVQDVIRQPTSVEKQSVFLEQSKESRTTDARYLL